MSSPNQQSQRDRGRLLLEVRGVTKEFPGTKALSEVNLSVHEGEIVALLGENGAGKSTLMKILSGVWPAGSFSGEVRVAGMAHDCVPASFQDTRDAHAAGIAMIHQELAVFPELTVAEHLELDQLPVWIRWDQLHRRVQGFLDTLNFGLRSDQKVGDLSVGGRQLVEIARALYRDARILVFDEPTSALTEQEVQRLDRIILNLREEGRGIIYITHRMDEIFRLADRMVVLRDGQNAGESSAYEVHSAGNRTRIPREELEPKLISWMVGRPLQAIYPELNSNFGENLLRVENLTLARPSGKRILENLSFSVRRGEVVGLAGLLGAGRSETFEALFGVVHGAGPRGVGYQVDGNVWIRGKRKFPGTPAEALGARMGFVSEDRKGSGLILNQSIRNNLALAALVAGRAELAGVGGWLAPIDFEKESRSVEHWMKELRIKAAHADQPVSQLSGGNQQKVVLAKWLLTEPEILFLDEPTRGVDIGAKAEIYQWIQRLAAQGIGIVVASSEMPELLGICHRILVMREGQFTADLDARSTYQEEIMRAASL